MMRVMQINQGEKYGGVSSMLYNFYQHIDRNQVQFDFVAPRHSSFDQFRSEIESMGGRIIELNADGFFIFKKFRFWKRLKALILKEKYEVIHINSGSILFNIQCAFIAKSCHVKKIIVHSHNAGADGDWKQRLSQLCKPLLNRAATDFWACSHKAAAFMYTPKRVSHKEYLVINNGIDVHRFSFNEGKRQEYREQLGIHGGDVLIHVGRFSRQKNHIFLIKLFQKYVSLYPDATLLLVGTGDLVNEVKSYAEQLQLGEKVQFLGIRNDIPELMSAADVFVLPSLYEGLPVVGIEAQSTGLPCIFSDQITSETDVRGHNQFISLHEELEKWCESIHEAASAHGDRTVAAKEIQEKGYSIQAVSEFLQNFYLS